MASPTRSLLNLIDKDNPDLTPAITQLQMLPVQLRHDYCIEIVSSLLHGKDYIEEFVAQLHEYVTTSDDFRSAIPANTIEANWERAGRISTKLAKHKERILGICERVILAWGRDNANAVLDPNLGYHFAEAIRSTVNTQMGWIEFSQRPNRVMFNQLTRRSRGRSKSIRTR